ncbi:type VI secretion system Vgr family protein [Roseiarcus sp.]|uniref:type VI secretion system Vgr family protein n=1 Tax=Roseiarcus sp. TaxID=1969460 RepID=UPI003F98E30F
MSISQDAQQGKLTTPLGKDVLGLARFSAIEGLSELFEIRIEAASKQANLDFSSALGLGATIEFTTQDNQTRYFHGLMTEARWAGTQEDLYLYQMVLRPWLWFLTRTSDCKIFAQMTAIAIIKQVFSDRGFSDYRDATTGSPPTLEYCVQYRETDFNFVCRLMEQFGVYYFFEYADGKHTLVLADAKSSHSDAPGLSTVDYNPVDNAGRRESQYIETWSLGRRAQSGVFVLKDYPYKAPSTNLLAQKQGAGGYGHDSMEMFDYPYAYVDTEGNNFQVQSVGENLAKYKLEAAQSLDQRRSSMGAAASLFPGALVTLQSHPDSGENQEYLVTHCTHDFEEEGFRSGADADLGYTGNYEMTPSSRQFRAPLVTRKPEIVGVQSALVIKKDGGPEIDVDSLGRILVQFYWDRQSKPSRRVRVAQIWAGANRGALFTPRVGDEVLIQYEEGDPDRPIVVGSVYNGQNTVPMTLPDKQVKSGILTLSSTGGSGYNMFLFDDTAGSEKVKLRAQKDLMFKALNDEKRDIVHDQTENVGNNETINVGFPVGSGPPGSGNLTLNVLNKVTINVGPQGQPMTQLIMDTSSITLNVGPSGSMSQIVMNTMSTAEKSTQITKTGNATVSVTAPMVQINS